MVWIYIQAYKFGVWMDKKVLTTPLLTTVKTLL